MEENDNDSALGVIAWLLDVMLESEQGPMALAVLAIEVFLST